MAVSVHHLGIAIVFKFPYIFLSLGEYIRCVPAGGRGELHEVPAGHGHPGEGGQAPGQNEVCGSVLFSFSKMYPFSDLRQLLWI